MKAVLLVGGEGTRLRPLTYDLPKPLFPVAGVPYLERLAAFLKKFGVDELILTACYLSSQIESFCGRARALGVKCDYVVEDFPLGTGGAVGNVADRLDSTFLVFNGDILTDFDLSALIAFHRNKKSSLTLALVPVADPSRFGVADLAPDGRILRFVEKPSAGDAPSKFINAGMYVVEPDVLKLVSPGVKVSIEREIFPRVAERSGLFGLVQRAYWLDMGTPADYLQAHFDFLEKKIILESPAATDVRAAESAKIIPPVYIGSHCEIESGAVIGPLAVIGNHCRIGTGAKIDHSVLWNGVLVGEGARIIGSILGEKASVARGRSVENEIIRSASARAAEGLLS